MENTENNLVVSQSVREALDKMVYWAKFLAIIGYIGIGLMVFAAIAMIGLAELDYCEAGGILGSFLYIGFAALYYFPVHYLYVFSINARKALNSNTQIDLDLGLSNLASNFKFVGVMTLVVLSIYALVFIIGIGSFMFSSL